MSRVENVIRYYCLTNKLKDLIRTGWKEWHLKRDRLESVAEHVYGVQNLAIAIYSEYNYNIDIYKVLFMIAIHELEEIIIGDIPVTSKDHDKKEKKGHQAIKKILNPLLKKDEIEALIIEFDKRETKEALFAYHCDKLECDLQAKLYDEDNCFSLETELDNQRLKTPSIQNLIAEGKKTFAELWFPGDEKYYYDDKNFMEIFKYAENNCIKFEDEKK